jgi:hypothetical protein
VADPQNNDVSPWLERELARQLAPVAAPGNLWYRIHQPREEFATRRVSGDWFFWPVVAVMVLLVCAGAWRTLVTQQNPDNMSDQDLLVMAKSSSALDFRSESFDEIRRWVKAEANIDIDVPGGPPVAERVTVKMLGARLIHFHGMPVAVVDYLVGAGVATLFVSGKHAGLRGDSEVTKHLFSDQPRFSWNMRNETYTIAYSGSRSSRPACLLCHPAITP